MKRQVRQFKERAINSLILGIEAFNRPYERGRVEAVLIWLNHAFEMLLKAAIVEQRGSVEDARTGQSYTFQKCLNIAQSDLGLLDEDAGMTLSIINDLRDCAMHNVVEVSEQLLYTHAQCAVSRFDELLRAAFGEPLAQHLPDRVLPVSVNPPHDLELLMDSELDQLKQLLAPGRRRKATARARLRPIAIMERNTIGRPGQPAHRELSRLMERLAGGEPWRRVFPGVAALVFGAEGEGTPFSLFITRRQEEGIPVRLVAEGEEPTAVIAERRVDLLETYPYGLRHMAVRLGVTEPKLLALITVRGFQSSDRYFREFTIGKSRFKRYSQAALHDLGSIIDRVDLDAVWHEYQRSRALAARQQAS
jgi:hypothetical protein